jgi:hypothetical protein
MIAWYHLIDDAQNPHEVVAITRDYIASWTPQELALLPVACRPGKLRDEEDIEMLHSSLVDEYRNTRASGEELSYLQQLTSFLVRASIRIAELRDGPSRGGSSGATKTAAPRE